MPMLPGKANIGRNIAEMAKNHPRRQAIAAALREAGVPKKKKKAPEHEKAKMARHAVAVMRYSRTLRR